MNQNLNYLIGTHYFLNYSILKHIHLKMINLMVQHLNIFTKYQNYVEIVLLNKFIIVFMVYSLTFNLLKIFLWIFPKLVIT